MAATEAAATKAVAQAAEPEATAPEAAMWAVVSATGTRAAARGVVTRVEAARWLKTLRGRGLVPARALVVAPRVAVGAVNWGRSRAPMSPESRGVAAQAGCDSPRVVLGVVPCTQSVTNHEDGRVGESGLSLCFKVDGEDVGCRYSG